MEARSSVVEHCFDVAGVSGSIPLVPTKYTHNKEVIEIYDSKRSKKSAG